jgi:ethanolamine transporter EutH
MFLPAEYQYLEPTVIAAGVVFVVALIGNVLTFSSRFVNALVTAVLFGAIFGGLAYVTYKEGIAIPTTEQLTPTPAPAPTPTP